MSRAKKRRRNSQGGRARKRRKAQGRRIRLMRSVTIAGDYSPMPKMVTRTHRWDYATLASGTGTAQGFASPVHRFNMNDPEIPQYGVITHLPYGFDQMADLYQLRKVISCTVTHRVYCNSNSINMNGNVFFISWLDDDLTLPLVMITADASDFPAFCSEQQGFTVRPLPASCEGMKLLASAKQVYSGVQWSKQLAYDENDEEVDAKFNVWELANTGSTKKPAYACWRLVQATASKDMNPLVVYTTMEYKVQWKDPVPTNTGF